MRSLHQYLIIICSICMCFSFKGNGQGRVMLSAYVHKDSIMLRWAPSDFTTWQKGSKYGYKLERILLSKDGNIPNDNRISMLHDGVFKPLPEEGWGSIVAKDSIWAPIALQALWGDTFEMTSSFRTNVMQAYNKVRENESRYGFAMYSADRSLSVAKALGVYFADKRILKGEKYIYRVYVNAPNYLEAVDTTYVVVDPSKNTELFKPIKPEITRMGNSILLYWKANSMDYVGFYVERSYDGKRFNRITKDVVIPFQEKNNMVAYQTDSIVGGQKEYYYRIVGLSPFGFTGSYSDTARIVASKGITSPTKVDVAITRDGKVTLSWCYDDASIILRGFRVLRSRTASGRYEQIDDKIGPKQRRWTDIAPLSSGYYKIVAISKDEAEGESLETFVQLVDDTPPLPPTGMEGVIDSLGVVRLKWKQNAEPDLMGYRIYRGNSTDGEYSQITKSVFIGTQYTDTITVKTLTKNVFYKLVAVDKRYNASDFSQNFMLKRPDSVAPAPPVVKSLEQEQGKVHIKWEPSPSFDVTSVVIYKKGDRANNFTKVASVSNLMRAFSDTANVDDCLTYNYWVVSVDSAGNCSIPSNSMQVNVKRLGKNFDSRFTARVIIEGDVPAVKLSWAVESPEQMVYLYKREVGKPFRLYRTLTDALEFIDEMVSQGKGYEYMVVINRQNSKVITLMLN